MSITQLENLSTQVTIVVGKWIRGRVCMHVCMYLMIGEGQIARKKPYWGENRLNSKTKGKHKCLVIFLKLADPVPMLL